MTFQEVSIQAFDQYGVSRETFLAMFTWLLKHSLLVQLRRYFYLIVPSRNTPSLAGPKKVRAGDTMPVGGPASKAAMRTDAFAAAAQADLTIVAEEAQAAEHRAEQAALATQSSQAMHAENSTFLPGFFHHHYHHHNYTSSSHQSQGVLPESQSIPGQETSAEAYLQARRNIYGSEQTSPERSRLRDEAAFLDAIAADSEVYRLFRRLTRYFHGRHHASEIAWRENISLEALEKVVATYNDVVYPYVHP